MGQDHQEQRTNGLTASDKAKNDGAAPTRSACRCNCAARGTARAHHGSAPPIRSYPVNARLVGVLGALTLVLAVVGLNAVTAYLVAQRTRELGVRMTIGTQAIDVLRDVMGSAAQRALVGMVIGALATVSLLLAVKRFLFRPSLLDSTTLALAA